MNEYEIEPEVADRTNASDYDIIDIIDLINE